MNLRTTIVLGLLVILGAAGWAAFLYFRPERTASPTLALLNALDAKKLDHVEVKKGDEVLVSLQRIDGVWQLPGNWPLRESEVADLVNVLTGLNSRYEAVPLPGDKEKAEAALKKYGLTEQPLVVTLSVDGKKYNLTLGEPAAEEKNKFIRPTYLRLDKEAEVVRLGPGLLTLLDRPQEFYQKRQLFQSTRVAKDEKAKEKIDELIAKEIRVIGPGAAPVVLVKEGTVWELSEPRDRVDPDRVKALLNKTPDIWAESFVEADAVKKKSQGWFEPLTGLIPTLPKRDFFTSQAVYVASQALLQGPEGLFAPGATPYLVAQNAYIASQALPVYNVKVTRPDGGALTLHVGGVSRETRRKTTRTITLPGKPPITVPDEVVEEFRYARVEDPASGKGLTGMALFEVKGEVLKELPTDLDELRDSRLVRFEADEAKRLEILTPSADAKKPGDYDTTLLLAKTKQEKKITKKDPDKEDGDKKDEEVWTMTKPSEEAVERDALDDLLRELARLEAKGENVFYPKEADLARFGLDKPALVIKVTYEEPIKDAKKPDLSRREKVKEKKTREATLYVGSPANADLKSAKKDEKAVKKVYVRVEGWPRVSLVDAKLLELAERPAYAYRSRKVLDLAADDVKRLDVQRAKDGFVVAKEKGEWRLEAPVKAGAEKTKVQPLVREVSEIEAVEFVADKPGKEELEKLYGLATPAATIEITLDDAKKAKRILKIGNKRPDRPDYFARLDEGPVFVLKNEKAEILLRDSLAYRALPVWDLKGDDIASLGIERKEGAYRLVRDGEKWKIAGAIDAPASKQAQSFALQIAGLRADRYVEHAAKDLAKYGLDAPHLKVKVKLQEKDSKERALLIGKTVDKEDGRYAKLDSDGGVFVLEGKAVDNLERTAYDWLDKVLLTVNPLDIQSIQASGKANFTLAKKSGEWQITKSPAPDFTAEEADVMAMLRPWRSLQAEKIADQGSKIDWKKYGLDKPYLTLTVNVALGDSKPIQHTLALGNEAGKGERYARMDKSEFVAVLSPEVVEGLDKGHVDFLPLQVLRYTITELTGLNRTMPGGDVTVAKRGEQWFLDKPYDRPADDLVVGEIIDRTFRLKAQRIAAYPAKDLATYGLDKPAAVVKFILTDPTGAPNEEVLLIGGLVDAKSENGERFAKKAKDDKVFVLSADLSKHFTAQPLSFADRNLITFGRADQAVQERAARKAVFTKSGMTWKMTAPVDAAAEDNDLGVFVKDLSRLRAGEIVAVKPDAAQLKTFGLEKPEATWILRQGDKQVFKLLIGGPEAGKAKDPRRYAMTESGDFVFLLTPKMTQQALAEYRDRKPWTVDAAQVEDLRVQSPAGPFRLAKRESRWMLFERPDDKVNTKALNDTLDALADLKVTRYLTDKENKEQEVLTGLQKPEWTIQAGTGKDNVALLIGRKVGDTANRYARTGANPAIFIIAAETLERILKPQAGFLGEAKVEEKKSKGAEKE